MKINYSNMAMLVVFALFLGALLRVIIPGYDLLRIVLMIAAGFFWPYPVIERQ